jgi:hypothetical protein
MKEQDVVEAEGLVLTDLGDAAEQTRQWHPSQVITDSAFVIGIWFLD